MPVSSQMRCLVPVLLVAACGGGSTFIDAAAGDDAPVPDATSTVHDGPVPDGAAPADAAPADAAPADATALCEQSAVGRFAVVSTGASSSRVITVTTSTDPAATDGEIGTVDLALDDIANVSGFSWVGVDGTSLYQLTPPDTVGGAYTHSVVGSAPGIRALFSDSIHGLYGAGGGNLYHITISPFAVNFVANVGVSGCSGIADLGLEDSGGSTIYDLVLDCTAGDRYEQLIDVNNDGNLNPVIVGPAGPTDMAGFTELAWAVSSSGLYQVQAGAFVLIRPLSTCLGLPAGSMRGLD